MTDPDRFLRLESLFREAAALPIAERESFLSRHCADDPDLLRRLREMLHRQASSEEDSFLKNATAAARGVAGPSVGEKLGPYQLLETLGEGGMGTVFLAEQRQPVRRRVALKVIKLGMDTKAVLARFEAERQALSMMEHGAVARIYDAGTTKEGRPYFAMEYVKGVPITDYCDENKLSIAARIELFRLVCAGVQHAHTKGVMHRDLKPGNILVTLQDGRPMPKIIDFGLAKAVDHRLVEATIFTQHGQIIGTPEYMSPEQAGLSGLDVDTRTDIYSLGVLLYELLTGELPFSRTDLAKGGYLEMQRILRETEPPKPSTRITTVGKDSDHAAKRRGLPSYELRRRLRGDLDWIVLKALEKDRTRRYETAQELAADLQRHLEELPVHAGPPSSSYRLRKYVRRHKVLVGAGATIALSLGAGIAIASTGWAEANTQALRANAALDNFRTLSFVVQNRTAREKERMLYPPRPGMVGAMESWRREEYEPLQQQRERIQAVLSSLPGAGATDANPELVFLREQLTDASRQLEQLDELERSVRDRIEFAKEIEALTESHPGQHMTWQQAQEVVDESPKYKGSPMTLKPQLGLVPMGVNPESGLLEFYDLQSAWTPGAGKDPKSLPIPKAGKSLESKESMGIVYVLVPGGTFWMGSPQGDEFAKGQSEQPEEEVTLEPYLLSRYELTEAQWARVAKDLRPAPPRIARSAKDPEPTLADPVTYASWDDCMEMLRRIDATLPTEAQWERAARAGVTDSLWSTGNTPSSLEGSANVFDRRARHETLWDGDPAPFSDGWTFQAPVGSFKPNAFGLFDLHGNVWEWCLDPFGQYGKDEPRPGDGLRSGDSVSRALRGGSYGDGAAKARSAMRFAEPPSTRTRTFGARAARILTQ